MARFLFSSGTGGDASFEGDCLNFPNNGTICNIANSSGDGYGYSTFEIIPDITRIETDQYLIIDPTAPNHIHIRAGGTQDSSNAELILGGELTAVKVTDYNHTVSVTSYNAELDSMNFWYFQNDGVLSGPGMGNLLVYGIYGPSSDYPLPVASNDRVLLNGTNGEFLNDADVPSNQIATIGDIEDTVSDVTSYNPTWSGTGLSFTGTPATGYYIKVGRLVQVQIDVEFDNVSDFGTGQYSITLPFASAYHTDVYGGSVHDVGATTDHYSIKGHLSPSSSTMTIWNLKSSAQDEPFDHNSPFVLTTGDKFHMSFSYICV